MRVARQLISPAVTQGRTLRRRALYTLAGVVAACLLASLVTSLVAACGGPASAWSRHAEPAGVVVVCVDTLRADVAGVTGTGAGRLPSVAAFARDAVTFEDATAAAPWTAPSVASLLTGLRPSHHGVGPALHDGGPHPISPAVRTIAEVLRSRGWFTAAATAGGWLTREQGADRGFAAFTSDFDLYDPAEFVAQWQSVRPRGRPFFLFLHTFVAHDPYGDKGGPPTGRCEDADAPEAVRVADGIAAAVDRGGEVPRDLYADAIRLRWTDVCGRLVLDRRLGTERLRPLLARTKAWTQSGWRDDPVLGDRLASRLRAAYEAGMPVVDDRLGRIFAALASAGLPRETVVILTADHGEAFGEGGQLYHGQSLHDAVVRVPLVVRAPGVLEGGRVVRGSASLVDVLPTVLDLADVAPPDGLDGRSLLPLARGEGKSPPVVIEGERTPADGRPAIGLVAVRTPAVKWLLEYEVPTGAVVREAVYDLQADPEERRPRAPESVPSYGTAFCHAVARARAEVLARYGQPPPPAPCAVVH